MKKNSARKISRLAATVALVLGCAIGTVPLRAGAAEAGKETRPVWTAAEAEMAREVAEGVPLKEIITSSVRGGKTIEEVVAAAIKVGVDPSLVVYTSINEGYAAQTVVKAALKAGAPVDVVLSSASHEGQSKRSAYVGDIVAAAITIGADPSAVVYASISKGYPAQSVIKTALKTGAPLDAVVISAVAAGADRKAIYAGAADAGASPAAVERVLSAAGTPESIAEKQAGSPSIPSEVALSSRSLEPPPAIFGIGGVVLTRVPPLSQTSQVCNIGTLKINPFLALSEAFTDNVFFTADNRKEDSITTITPGIRLKLPFQTHSAELEYYSVITRYAKEFSFDDTSDYHLNAAVDLVFGDRFEMRLSDQLAHDHEPRSSTTSGNIEVFDSNAASFSAAYRTSDLARIQIDYTRSDWRYLTGHFRDREEDLVAGTFFYRIFSRTSAFIEYGHRDIAYTYAEGDVDLDSKVDTVEAGLTWALSVRTKGTVKAGMARKDFTSSATENVTKVIGSADLRHEFTKDTTLVLTGGRTINEPNAPDIYYFITNGVYAELTHRIFNDWAAMLRGSYVEDLYSPNTSRTSLGGAGVTYRAANWIDFSIEYDWRQRNAIPSLDKYVEHITILTANISL